MITRQDKANEIRDLINRANELTKELEEDGFTVHFMKREGSKTVADIVEIQRIIKL